MFFYVFFFNIIKIKHFCIVLLYCYIKFLLSYIPNLYSFQMHMFLSNQLTAFFYHHLNLKPSSVNTLCLSLLYLCYVFSTSLLFFMNSLGLSTSILFFSNGLFYFQFELFLNSFYNLKVQVFFFLCLLLFILIIVVF